MRQITMLFLLIAFGFSTMTAANAVTPLNTNFTNTFESKADLPAWKMKIVEKFNTKIQKELNQKYPEGDIKIPGTTKQWLIYWIIGAIATIVLAIALPFSLRFLWQLLNAATGIAFIIWVLKLLELV